MAHRGRRYRRSGRYSNSYSGYVDWSEYHRKERAAVATKYGGIDEDIRRMFFNLDPPALEQIFQAYGESYGRKRLGYARRTYEKWKSGKVNMSGEVSERLLDILPRYMSFENKYTLIEKMWRSRNKRLLRITIVPSEGVAAAIQKVLCVVDTLDAEVLPEPLKRRLSWLAGPDAVVAKQLLLQLYADEREALLRSLQNELRRVADLIAKVRRSQVTSTHKFDIPGAAIEIVAEEPHWMTRLGRFFMSSDDNLKKDETQRPGPLVPKETETRNELAPIKDAETLLNNALQYVTPEKKQEIIDKAAEESLRLQTKRAHNELEREMVDKMLDTAGRTANQAERTPNAHIEYNDHIQKEHGTTRIEVKSQSGFCFVATACFGDYNHPTVKILRQFRDAELLTTNTGTRFVELYYRYGQGI